MNKDPLKLSSYDYELPSELIACEPVFPKENARLLVFERKSGKIKHLYFGDLSEILPPCSIIFNDTKVVKARIYGSKESGAKIELLLNSPLGERKFSVLIRGHVKEGDILHFDTNLSARIIALETDGTKIVEFTQNSNILDAHELFKTLNKIGHVPLPPYIKRPDEKRDEGWYQSEFAKNEGAVAAPTASLHFSANSLKDLAYKHDIFYLTLHVGAGTFKPVDVENINEHKMHSEIYEIPENTAFEIDSNAPILGVGTTVTRCVEYYARTHEKKGACDLFLHPNNRPIRQDFLLTNFHLPKSTLIMLVASFIGLEKTLEIYREAVGEKYRFYSYGDAMLII